jgi:septal ring factor EnvC (AmiA/AmiB activator)
MSFIAVTYGYNMFSIFNLQSATQPLIDNIVVNCFDDLLGQLQRRVDQHGKEIDALVTEETLLKKKLVSLDEEKGKEEAKIEEQKKIDEEKKKEEKDKKKSNPPAVKSYITSYFRRR